jgi:hypothetical protein
MAGLPVHLALPRLLMGVQPARREYLYGNDDGGEQTGNLNWLQLPSVAFPSKQDDDRSRSHYIFCAPCGQALIGKIVGT